MSASRSLSHLSSCKLPVYQSGHHRRDLYCRHSGSSNSIILRNDHGTSRDYICDNYICAKIKEVKPEWFEIQKYSPGETVEVLRPVVWIFPKCKPKVTLVVKTINRREMRAVIQHFLLFFPSLAFRSMQPIWYMIIMFKFQFWVGSSHKGNYLFLCFVFPFISFFVIIVISVIYRNKLRYLALI